MSSTTPAPRWSRRRFLKIAGATSFVSIVAAELPGSGLAWSAPSGGGPCAYGAGPYGGSLFSSAFADALPRILAGKSANDLTLSWPAITASASYEVWRSDAPFEPGDPGSTLLSTVGGTSYTDAGALAAPGDAYYVVRGILTCN